MVERRVVFISISKELVLAILRALVSCGYTDLEKTIADIEKYGVDDKPLLTIKSLGGGRRG